MHAPWKAEVQPATAEGEGRVSGFQTCSGGRTSKGRELMEGSARLGSWGAHAQRPMRRKSLDVLVGCSGRAKRTIAAKQEPAIVARRAQRVMLRVGVVRAVRQPAAGFSAVGSPLGAAGKPEPHAPARAKRVARSAQPAAARAPRRRREDATKSALERGSRLNARARAQLNGTAARGARGAWRRPRAGLTLPAAAVPRILLVLATSATALIVADDATAAIAVDRLPTVQLGSQRAVQPRDRRPVLGSRLVAQALEQLELVVERARANLRAIGRPEREQAGAGRARGVRGRDGAKEAGCERAGRPARDCCGGRYRRGRAGRSAHAPRPSIS